MSDSESQSANKDCMFTEVEGLCNNRFIAGSSNGRTQVSGACNLGSSPSPAANTIKNDKN